MRVTMVITFLNIRKIFNIFFASFFLNFLFTSISEYRFIRHINNLFIGIFQPYDTGELSDPSEDQLQLILEQFCQEREQTRAISGGTGAG